MKNSKSIKSVIKRILFANSVRVLPTCSVLVCFRGSSFSACVFKAFVPSAAACCKSFAKFMCLLKSLAWAVSTEFNVICANSDTSLKLGELV